MKLLEQFKRIRVFAFDVDGVLTDGTVLVLENGEQARTMHIRDGFALQLAVKKGYHLVVISGSNSPAVVERLRKLGVTDVFMNVEDKQACLETYLSSHGLTMEETLFMGDDIPDYSVMQRVGLACAPADAAPQIRNLAKYISSFTGGTGCVRDVIEKVLTLNNHWELHTNIRSR
jgi:3-deoxy-D-manno-octulosonate 8-phosphate phosphatase (KDO 8-P phosphatase)